MNISEIITIILKREHVTMTALGQQMGSSRQIVSQRLRQRSLAIGIAEQMLRKLGYKIMIVPVGTELPESGFELK